MRSLLRISYKLRQHINFGSSFQTRGGRPTVHSADAGPAAESAHEVCSSVEGITQQHQFACYIAGLISVFIKLTDFLPVTVQQLLFQLQPYNTQIEFCGTCVGWAADAFVAAVYSCG